MDNQKESPTISTSNDSSLLKTVDSEIENLDYTCGLFNFRPKWLQKFARKQVFLLVFCLTSVLQGMYFTYIVSVLTTIEKLYQLPSRTTGFLISSVEIGQISGSLSLTYFGNKGGHRPKMIAAGIILFAFANLLCSSPHFFLPSELEMSIQADRQILRTNNLLNNRMQLKRDEISIKDKLCSIEEENFLIDATGKQNYEIKCKNSNGKTNKNKITFFATCIFFTAAICVGFGSTAVNTLGIPYIDDNVTPKESPLYFAITIGIKIFGPVLGFLLGSLCTSIYINFPYDNGHGLTPSHPEWIGAWWLGVFMLGIVIIFNSIFMMSFPKKLPACQNSIKIRDTEDKYVEKTYKTSQKLDGDNEQKKRYSKLHIDRQLNSDTTAINNNQLNQDEMNCCNFKQIDSSLALKNKISKNEEKKIDAIDNSFLNTIKRLLKNRILLCRIASTIFHTLPVSGLYTFLPKYLEYQFRITASDASFVSGIAGILVMGIGIFTSGIFMRKYNPSPKFVSSWICIATFLYVLGMVGLMSLGCQLPKISNLNVHNMDKDLSLNCPNCHCESNQFLPICASNSITYLSPCSAGCTQFNKTGSEYNFLECKCLPDQIKIIKNGFCDVECKNLFWYIVVFSTIALLHSTTEVGAMLITLRSVNPADKTSALGLVSFITSLFASFPCPTFFGAIIDTACIFWQKNCDGTNGACRLYDSDKFRIYLHGLTAFFMFIAFLFDVCVWFMSSNISFLENEKSTDLNQNGSIKNDHQNNQNNDTNNNIGHQKNDTNLKLRSSFDNNDGNNNLSIEDKIKNSNRTNDLISS